MERLYQKTQKYNDVLQEIVERHPEQWLWIHRRWKKYSGVPRWVLKSEIASLLFVVCILQGCATIGETPTGIPLPPDPHIAIPKAELIEESPNVGVIDDEAPAKKSKKKKIVAAPVHEVNRRPSAVTKVFRAEDLPFELGEQQEIDINWMNLPAGRITLEVRQGIPIEKRPTFRFWGNLLSSKMVDTIYHVDNTIESFVDKEWLIQYKFLLHMVETKQKKETRVSFDHVQNKAFYWSQKLSGQWGNETQDRVDLYPPGSKDMFSAVYFARTMDYEIGKKLVVPVYENNKKFSIELLPEANEFIMTSAGAFQCIKIHVTAKLDNVLQPNGDVYMWLSNDSKKYLVKFDAKLKLGALRGDLVRVRERFR